MNCPLCKNEDVIYIDTINKNELIFLYKKTFNVDVSYLIKENINYCECKRCSLIFYDPLITGDEKFYNAFQKFDWYYMDEKEEYMYAKKYIKSNDKVLEVGSGKGAFAKYLETKDYIGLDFIKNAKKMVFENGIKIENETIQDYAKKYSESFDIVVSFQVLEHVSDPKSFIESKIKALKMGGKLIVAVPSENSFLKYVTNGILNMPPHHVTRWSDETLRFISYKYNLKLIDIWHEKLQNVHKLWYLSTFIQNSILKPKLIDLSFKRKVVGKFASLISRILYKGFKNEMLPVGQTIVAVYEKIEK